MFLRKKYFIFFTLLLSSCSWSYSSLEFYRGESYFENKEFAKALSFYRRIIYKEKKTKFLKPSLERVLYINSVLYKDHDASVDILYKLFAMEKDKIKKNEIIYKMANIYFFEKKDFNNALLLYYYLNRLENKFLYQKQIILCYIYLAQYEQALIEMQLFESNTLLSKSEKFNLMKMKTIIYQHLKDYEATERNYRRLMELFPKLSYHDKVPLAWSLFYQDQGRIEEAIKILKDYSQSEEDSFYKMRIQRLEVLQEHQPKVRRRYKNR